jgi:MFS family permease
MSLTAFAPASRTTPRRTLGVCCAAHVVHDGLADVSYVLLPILAQAFGLSLTQVGLIRSAWRAATAIFQTPAGLAAEHFGARNLLAFGTACAGLAFILLGQAAGFSAVLITLFCAGFGSAFQHPISSTLISHAYPDAGRRIALGTYNFFGDVGKLAFGSVVSVLFIAGVAWQAPITAYGVVALACAAAVMIALPHGAGGIRAAKARGADEKPIGWGIKNRRGFLALCAIEVLDGSTRHAFLTFVAFLMLARDLPAGWAALSVPLIFVGGMAGKLACGFLAERLGIVRTIALTEAATGAGILSLLVLPDLPAFLILPLVGIALNGTSSVLYASVGDLVEGDRLPRAFGLFYTIGAVCGLVVPLAFGLFGDVFGITTAIGLSGLLPLLTLPLCAVLSPALRALKA